MWSADELHPDSVTSPSSDPYDRDKYRTRCRDCGDLLFACWCEDDETDETDDA